MLVQGVLSELNAIVSQNFPERFLTMVLLKLKSLFFLNLKSSQMMTLQIEGPDGTNELYEASEIYLQTKITRSMKRLKVSKSPRENKVLVTMKIHMSYCTPGGFRILASNYLGISSHDLFTEIDELIMEVKVTPAEVAEEFMKCEDADIALAGLVKFLQNKKSRSDSEVVMKTRKKCKTKTEKATENVEGEKY